MATEKPEQDGFLAVIERKIAALCCEAVGAILR